MKETVTNFDLEAAFKALDEIDYPKTEEGLKANRAELSEMFSKKLRTEILVEDYYNVNDPDELEVAQEDREADIAKAKLARIEKIVDLDAESEEDLLPSYVGKIIIQCPQCMTLFYKKPEEIEYAEDSDNTVNVGEKCQHCGSKSGYNLVGKVDEVSEAEAASYVDDELNTGVPTEEENLPEVSEEEISTEAEPMPEMEVESEEEVKEESFNKSNGAPLNEEVDAELNKKLEEHNEYIKYLQDQIEKEEKALESEKNEFVKASIEESINALKVKLEEAIPEEVKVRTASNEETMAEEPQAAEVITAEEEIAEPEAPEEPEESKEPTNESLAEGLFNPGVLSDNALKAVGKLFEADDDTLTEADDSLPAVTDNNIETMLDDFDKNPITTDDVEEILDQQDDFDDLEDIDEASVNESINNYLNKIYSNIANSNLTECYLKEDKLILNNLITFKSGKSKTITFELAPTHKGVLEGYNKDLSKDSTFALEYHINNKCIITESLKKSINKSNN